MTWPKNDPLPAYTYLRSDVRRTISTCLRGHCALDNWEVCPYTNPCDVRRGPRTILDSLRAALNKTDTA